MAYNVAENTDTTDSVNALDVKLEDKDILRLIKQPLQDGATYWNETYGLRRVGRDNMNLWLPQHWKDQEVYDYQEMSTYMDPRIFTSVETIASTINARIPQIEIMPGQDTPISLHLAKDVQKSCAGFIEKYDILDLFRLSARNLQLKRGGFIKLRFNPNKGEHGEIECEFVPVEDIVVDSDAKMGQTPRFMAHRIRNHTAEELIAMFPDAKQKILRLIGTQRVDKKGNLVAIKTALGKKLDILECWFRYWEDSEWKSGVCWVDENFQEVLDKDRNPNWNYETKEGRVANILDEPAPPFIPINHLNDGSKYFDLTSLIEQAASLQKVLNKRGFQIMDNADQGSGGLVFNTQMITKEDIAKLTGSPDERIGVKGNVRDAVTRIAPPPLATYVIQDKMDARNEIDNVFSTHNITRGEESANDTLGQDVLQQRGDMSRMDDIARAVERQVTGFCRYLVQMMKVYYTEDHWFKAVGEDGQFDFVVMRSDLIENGIDIRVAAGSMMPLDKASQAKWVSDLAKAGLIDPLTIYEVANGGNLPSPKKMLERWTLFKTNPVEYAGISKDADFSRQALLDIQVLNEGQMPKIREEYDAPYLNFINNYMMEGKFDKQPLIVKNMFIEHMRIIQDIVNRKMTKMMTQMPTQEELNLQMQREAEQAAMQQQAAPADSGQPEGGAKGETAGGDQLAQQLAAAQVNRQGVAAR